MDYFTKVPSASTAYITSFNDMIQKRKGETKRAAQATPNHKVLLLILEKESIVFAATGSCIDLIAKTRGMGITSLASGVVIIIREKRTI